MPKRGKRFREAVALVEPEREYEPSEAVNLAKRAATASFDETVEVHLRTGADPRHADQMVRGIAMLPHGLGKTVRVLVFAEGETAAAAREAGADYVAFGAFFATDTKQAKSMVDAEILRWWSELFEIPSVAIGGITVDNCRPLVVAGADFLSVVAGVWNHPRGPAAAVRDFNSAITEASLASNQTGSGCI